ncbi:uncharacterized protein SPSK_01541 [Sporothrix schenckii 1099-18]|uniref:Uncharacterized protein n=1 Tax=Sporothrix schenckii 1099-18 TaxID=1397361 RepID=A0A0F2MF27_SPOSC|nr:uncharacterized protein SPSK_01541 [Sporothrix schenckii 1099-18]KJR87430.1 hypothetical protein SPSK_01541 [Sporothrix schenckii 1099-18]
MMTRSKIVRRNETTLKKYDLRLDKELGCLFCASCTHLTYPIGPSSKAYCQHRLDWHEEAIPAADCQPIQSSLCNFGLRNLKKLPRAPDGSSPVKGLPIFQAFKCVECEFATLQADKAHAHHHTTGLKFWQSYIQPKSDFQRHSWTVSVHASPQLDSNTTAETRCLQSEEDLGENTRLEPATYTTTGDGSFGFALDCLVETEGSKSQLINCLPRVMKGGLNEFDVVHTIRKLIDEKGQDGSIHLLAPWDYRTLHQAGSQIVSTAVQFDCHDHVICPIVKGERWFVLVVCTRIGHTLCLDTSHQMQYEPAFFLANYFKTCFACAVDNFVCPKTTPMAANACDSGVLVLGLVKKFIDDPKAAAQAVLRDDAKFEWNAKPVHIRRALVYRLAPAFYDAYDAIEDIKNVSWLINQLGKECKLAESIVALSQHYQELAHHMASLAGSLLVMRDDYSAEYDGLEQLLSIDSLPIGLVHPKTPQALELQSLLEASRVSGDGTCTTTKSQQPPRDAVGNRGLSHNQGPSLSHQHSVSNMPLVSSAMDTVLDKKPCPQTKQTVPKKRSAESSQKSYQKRKRQRRDNSKMEAVPARVAAQPHAAQINPRTLIAPASVKTQKGRKPPEGKEKTRKGDITRPGPVESDTRKGKKKV